MDQIGAALEGQHKNWEGVKYVRIDGSTDSLDGEQLHTASETTRPSVLLYSPSQQPVHLPAHLHLQDPLTGSAQQQSIISRL